MAAPDLVLTQLCDRLLAHGGYLRVTAYLREPGRDAYRPLTCRGRGAGAWAWTLSHRPFPTASADPALGAAPPQSGSVRPQRVVRHPLDWDGLPLGVLIGESDPHGPPVTARQFQELQDLVDESAPAVSISLRYRQAARDRDSLAALGDVVTRINGAIALDPLLEAIVVHARRLLSAASCRLEFICPDEPASRELVAADGDTQQLLGRRRPVVEGLGGFLLATRQPLAVFHRSAGRWSGGLDDIAGYLRSIRGGNESILGVPLEDPWGAPLGFISCLHPRAEQFSYPDLELLGRLAAQVALAVGKVRLLQQERARNADLQVLAEVAQAMTASTDRGDLLARATEGLARLAPGVGVDIALGARDAGQSGVPRRGRTTGTGPGAAPRPSSAVPLAPLGSRSIELPLRSGEDQLGVLTVTGTAAELPADRLAALATFGDQLAAALRIRQLVDSLGETARAAQRETRRFELITALLHDLVCLLDDTGRIRWASPSLGTACRRPEADLTGLPFTDLLEPADRAQLTRALAAVNSVEPSRSATAHVRLGGAPDGPVWLETILTRVPEDAGGGCVASSRVVTERKRLEDLLTAQAYTDSLTGLPNRARLLTRLEAALQGAAPAGQVAALFLDLDRFKAVNDSLGHDGGDALLVAVTGRLQRCVRPEDLIARLGGDEFVVLLAGVADAGAAAAAADRILAAFTDPVPVGESTLAVSVSIGIALAASGAGAAPADLIRDADVAMYQAKRAGRGRWSLFDPATRSRAVDRFSLEHQLRAALAADSLLVHYQPIVGLGNGPVHGVEALVRWPHPRRGLLLPAVFLSLAEETGLAAGIGRRVLAVATRAGARWREQAALADLKIAVNVSPTELMGNALASQVERALVAAALPPQALVLEITETSLWDDDSVALRQLLALRDLGVTLVLDDFGTGFSSLSHLIRLPVQIVKIDRSFTAALLTDPRAATLTRAVIRLGKDLALDVVAEGVETVEQAEELDRLGCPFGQGFLFSAPLPEPDVPAVLTGADPARSALSRLRPRAPEQAVAR